MGDLVYVGSCAGRFYGLSVLDGRVNRQFDVSVDGAIQFHGNPLVLDSMVIFATDHGRNPVGAVYAINVNTWQTVWKNAYPFGVPSQAAFDGHNAVCLVSRDDSVMCLFATSGEQRWGFGTGWTRPNAEFERDIEIPKVVSSPLYWKGSLYLVGRDSALYCLDGETGKKKWSVTLGQIITSSPVRYGGQILLGLESHKLVGISMQSGGVSKLGELPLLMLQTPSLIANTLFFLGGKEDARPREVVAFDLPAGEVLWRSKMDAQDESAFWYVPRIHIWHSWVVVGSTDGTVVAYDVNDGTEQWRHRLDGPIRGIGHSDSLLFVGTFEGTLHCLSVTTASDTRDK